MPKVAARIAQLTKARCEALKPEARRYRVTDATTKALKLVVEPGGRKFWSVRYVTTDGRNSEAVLGEWNTLLPEAARLKAEKLRGAVRSDGLDPGKDKKDRKASREASRANSFQALSEAYLAASKKGHFSARGRAKAESTLVKEEQCLKKHVLPTLGPRPIEEVRRRDIVALIERVASGSGHAAANGCLEVIRRTFAYGRYKDFLETNPALEIRPFPTEPRDVIASDGALRTLWGVLESAKQDRVFKRAESKPSEAYATATVLQLALLTLQRRGEVVRIRKEDVDLEKSVWIIPAINKKERRKGAVPLSAWAVEILKEAITRADSDWVFPGADGEEHLRPKTVTRFMERLRKRDALRREAALARQKADAALPGDTELLAASPIREITPHDLRRTGRTKLTGEELDIDERTAERVLNHSVGSSQQNAYDWNSYLKPKRNALEAWAGELRRIIDGVEASSNVVEIGLTRA